MSTAAPQCLSTRVQGRVQGVGFRYFVVRRARSLGLSGWVRNEHDGSVSLMAEGERALLEALLEAVSHGPSTAHVTHVAPAWSTATGAFTDFSVRF